LCGACEKIYSEPTIPAKSTTKDSEKSVCYGCKSSIPCEVCQECKIKQCALANEVEFCYDCIKYPCKLLLRFKSNNKSHHSAIIANLEEIKNFGLDEWLSKQKKRWSCPKCQNPFSWYENQCKTCGEILYNCKKEEKDILLDELSKLPLFFAL